MANTKIPSELVAINAISGTLIADNAITSVHIAENNITATQIAINAVTALQMADGTITSAKIADGTIVTADIADGQITTGKLADSSVTTAKIAAGTILGGDIANNAILTQHIDDNQITADQIADNAVGLDQMAGLTRGSVIYGNAAGNPTYLAAGTSGHVLTSDGTDISWTADTDLFLATAGGAITGSIIFDNNVQAIKIKDAAGTAGYVFYLDNADTLVIGNGTIVEKIRLDTSGHEGAIIIDTDGKVGIGASPSAPLHITHGTPSIKFTDSSSSANYSMTLDGVTVNNTNAGTNGSIAFHTHNGEKLRLGATNSYFSNTNVGIGTASPHGKLHLVETASGAAGIDFALTISSDRYQGDYGVGIAFRPENQSTGYKVKTAIIASGGGYGYNQADLHFCLDSDNTVTNEVGLSDARMTIKKSGNVGIGTTSPSSQLVVAASNGGKGIETQVTTHASNNQFILAYDRANSAYLNMELSALNFGIATNNGTNRFKILANGNVGIGTTAPTNKFGINRTSINTNERMINLYTGTTTANKYVSIGAQYSETNALSNSEIRFGNEVQSNAPSFLAFATGNNSTPSERMRITSGGDVVIGNTARTGIGERLNVTGAGIVLEATDGGITSLLGTFGGSDFIVGPYSSNNLVFRTGNTTRMKIDTSGDVLIGQASQTGYAFAQKLVVGDGDNNDGITIQSGSTHQGNLAFNHSDGTTAYGRISYQHNTNFMAFYTNNSEKWRFTSGGDFQMKSTNAAAIFGANGGATVGYGRTSGNGYIGIYGENNYSSCGAHIEIATNSNFGWSPVYINRFLANSGEDSRMIQFSVNGGEDNGTISYNFSNDNFELLNTSDYRLKSNIVNYTGGLAAINNIQVRKFTKNNADNIVGFIAHELQEHIPSAVQGEKDAVGTMAETGEEGAIYQKVSKEHLVPYLVSAIQEQQTVIQDLKSRIETLEG